MTAFLAKRIGIGLITLIVASVVVFSVLEVLPGDPALLMLGMNATPEALATLREQMGLNEPLLLRYLHWAGGMVVGDFGRSFTYSSPVIDLIAERAVVSLPLAIISLILSTVIAIPV
ncbi:MAG TPA: ABC transporter permease, partial [Mycoplana sp.]|nr:ABC transporter permease [Mycoplana sp.]